MRQSSSGKRGASKPLQKRIFDAFLTQFGTLLFSQQNKTHFDAFLTHSCYCRRLFRKHLLDDTECVHDTTNYGRKMKDQQVSGSRSYQGSVIPLHGMTAKTQKILVSAKYFARNSGAGNGCANFMGAWRNCALSAGITPCPINSSFFLGGGAFWAFWGREVPILLLWARGFF